MKTIEELSTLKEEVEALSKKLAELTKEELAQVTGGNKPGVALVCYYLGECIGEKCLAFIHPERIPDEILCPYKERFRR